MKDRWIAACLWGTAMLMVATLVHLASILILPHVATNDAFARIARQSPVNGLHTLAKPGSGQDGTPFRDPSVASAVCRYDLREGSLRVGAALGDAAFLSVSFHSRAGLAFYALTNLSGTEGRIDLVLLTPEQLETAEESDSEDAPVRDIRVTAPEPEGFIEFDILPRIGGYATARQALSSAGCKLERKS